MLHTSPYEVIDIKDDSGLFGSFLFFISGEPEDFKDAYQMSNASKYVHYIDEEELSLTDGDEMYLEADEEDIKDILESVMERIDVDQDTAFELICEKTTLLDLGKFNAEDDWWLQHMSAAAAVLLGYDGIELEDEQGGVFLVDMLGWRSTAIGEL